MENNKTQNSKAKGDSLEKKVALIYEILGFKVLRDRLISEHQIDLVAIRYVPGIGEIKIAIEVKSRSGNFGINDATKFSNTAALLLRNREITSAIIVTNGVISNKVRSALNDSGPIKVISVKELENQLFNNAEALFRACQDQESGKDFLYYYPLELISKGRVHNDAVEHLLSWSKSNKGIMVLIGDFGSGKTTILKRVFYRAAKIRIDDGHGLFPVYLELRGLRKHNSLWRFIEHSLRENQYILPSKESFYYQLERGNVILILDGFDEIYSGASEDDRANYLEFLRPILKTQSPVILSSRPTFFKSFSDLLRATRKLVDTHLEFERLPDFGIDPDRIAKAFGLEPANAFRTSDFYTVVEIQQLTKPKIREAIKKRSEIIKKELKMTPEDFENSLYDIYDLEDLMKRPLLLNMILETIATGAIDIKSQKPVGASTLYDIYTQHASYRDRERSRLDQYLSPEDRLKACRYIAHEMYMKREILLTSQEFTNVVTSVIKEKICDLPYEKGLIELTRAITDVRTCSFLRFSGDDSLSFSHKSFIEFFIAQDIYLASHLGKSQFLSYPRNYINREILYFLGSFARDQQDFAQFIRARIADSRSAKDKNFLYSLVFASGDLLEKCNLVNGMIADVELVRSKATGAFARSLTMQNVHARKLECESWRFFDVTMNECAWAEFSITSSEFEIISLGTTFSNSSFINSKLTFRGDHLTIDDGKISGCDVVIDCPLSMKNCIFEGGKLIIKNSAMLHGTKIKFFRMKFEISKNSDAVSPNTRIDIIECDLVGLWLRLSDIVFHLSDSVDRGIVFQHCSGVLFIEYNEIDYGHDFGELERRNENLLVIDKKIINEIEWCLKMKRGAREPRPSSSLRRKLSEAEREEERKKEIELENRSKLRLKSLDIFGARLRFQLRMHPQLRRNLPKLLSEYIES